MSKREKKRERKQASKRVWLTKETVVSVTEFQEVNYRKITHVQYVTNVNKKIILFPLKDKGREDD